MKILVAYDGTLHAKKALKYGINKLQNEGGDLTVLHVFDGSQFVDYDAGPRVEDMARHEHEGQLEDAKNIIRESASGLAVKILSEEGSLLRKLADQAAADRPDLVLAPRRLKEVAAKLSCPVILFSYSSKIAQPNPTWPFRRP